MEYSKEDLMEAKKESVRRQLKEYGEVAEAKTPKKNTKKKVEEL